jgi:signal transduction histidine kinase
LATHDDWRELAQLGAQVLTLPVVSYGQPMGTLCLHRSGAAFTAGDLLWLADVLHEVMPLLERADLLEQLQRETASSERERIGRDLHDSAIQPYLGLKYGLEALARQAGPANPIGGQIADLVHMATDELQALRDVIGGLRRGADPADADDAPLAALERQAQRFQVLYGLRVRIVATDAPRLRGAMAKAVLLMVNEALTNVRRHSSASEVIVQLEVRHSNLLLRVRNDSRERQPTANFVPRSLTERASALGGAVTVRHENGSTEIVIALPLMGVIA